MHTAHRPTRRAAFYAAYSDLLDRQRRITAGLTYLATSVLG